LVCPGRSRGPDIQTAAEPPRPPSKKQLGAKLAAIAHAHPDQRLQLWCEDEARFGQKGRTCHRPRWSPDQRSCADGASASCGCWSERGIRPLGLADKRFQSLYLFAACRPGTNQAFALALPDANTKTIGLFLEAFAQQLEPGIHAVLVLDQAGWHGAKQLKVPSNLTLLHLPPYSPELNPVERVWLYLRKRFLSHRVLGDYRGILDAICRAWNALTAETGRLKSRTAHPYLLRSQLPSVGITPSEVARSKRYGPSSGGIAIVEVQEPLDGPG
jgi:transposase